MPIKVTCTNCGGVLHAPDDAAGKRGRCPTCGTVLTISQDAPFVPPQASVPPPSASGPFEAASRPLPFPQPHQQSAPRPQTASLAGMIPGMQEASTEGPAPRTAPPGTYPVAPAPQRPPAQVQASMATGQGRKASAPGAYSDPFMKQGQGLDPAELDAVIRGWKRARRGLGWSQMGVILIFLGLIACPAIELAQTFGVSIPNQHPGYLKQAGLSSGVEIRAAAVVIPAVLGSLLIVLGRLSVASAPRDSMGKGLARLAAWFTLLAFVGMVAYLMVTGMATTGGSPPKLLTDPVMLPGNLTFSQQIEFYADKLFLMWTEPMGQVQRFGFFSMIVLGLIADYWFLHALGRYAAALQQPSAARRVALLPILTGLGIAVVLFGWLTLNMYGDKILPEIQPRWDNLGAKNQGIAIMASLLVGSLIGLVLYLRALGGVKRAIRDALEASGAPS